MTVINGELIMSSKIVVSAYTFLSLTLLRISWSVTIPIAFPDDYKYIVKSGRFVTADLLALIHAHAVVGYALNINMI